MLNGFDGRLVGFLGTQNHFRSLSYSFVPAPLRKSPCLCSVISQPRVCNRTSTSLYIEPKFEILNCIQVKGYDTCQQFTRAVLSPISIWFNLFAVNALCFPLDSNWMVRVQLIHAILTYSFTY